MLHPPSPRNERSTQNRVLQLLTSPVPAHNSLHYAYLGNHDKREKNSNLEESLLTANLTRRGYAPAQINAAIVELRSAIELRDDSLYAANQRAYRMLRYGAKVQTAAGERHATVHFIDWDHVEANDFAVAEEVTLKERGDERRPDLVFYVNGIALAVAELKREFERNRGRRPAIDQQSGQGLLIRSFFTTMQLLIAGNDTQGVRYGTVGTPEEFYTTWTAIGKRHPKTPPTRWRSSSTDRVRRTLRPRSTSRPRPLLRDLRQRSSRRCRVRISTRPSRPRNERLGKGEGGVIWHTQGSGKSILMVLLAQVGFGARSRTRACSSSPTAEELDDQIDGTRCAMPGCVGKR